MSIHSVERFLSDMARERGWMFERPSARTGKRILVVGAGPSGLSAAYHLARLGHEVEIRDAGAVGGGMMRYGIPSYRLPRDVLDIELNQIAAMGVRSTCDHRVEDLAAERDEGCFDAVFVAIGAHLAKHVDIPALDAGTMVDAVSFLRNVASGEKPAIGRRVAVYGGGNTAMDAARVAAASAPRKRSSSTVEPATRCPRTRRKPRMPKAKASGSIGFGRSPHSMTPNYR